MRKYSKKELDFYKTLRSNQNYNFSKYCLEKYCKNMNKKITIYEIYDKLDKFIDISDPDLELPNIVHAFQTAEKIRKDGHSKWFQLVGFIHDLGKIIYLKGCDKDGTSIKAQWAIVGDTFITGIKIPNNKNDPFQKFNYLNKDKNKNMYEPHCGLDNCVCSFGHDEYLYQILLKNKNRLPPQAYTIIRYHSLYLLHKYKEYQNLLNESDKEKIFWLELFNKYDLYSKENKKYTPKKIKILKDYYFHLFKKFFGKDYLYI